MELRFRAAELIHEDMINHIATIVSVVFMFFETHIIKFAKVIAGIFLYMKTYMEDVLNASVNKRQLTLARLENQAYVAEMIKNAEKMADFERNAVSKMADFERSVISMGKELERYEIARKESKLLYDKACNEVIHVNTKIANVNAFYQQEVCIIQNKYKAQFDKQAHQLEALQYTERLREQYYFTIPKKDVYIQMEQSRILKSENDQLTQLLSDQKEKNLKLVAEFQKTRQLFLQLQKDNTLLHNDFNLLRKDKRVLEAQLSCCCCDAYDDKDWIERNLEALEMSPLTMLKTQSQGKVPGLVPGNRESTILDSDYVSIANGREAVSPRAENADGGNIKGHNIYHREVSNSEELVLKSSLKKNPRHKRRNSWDRFFSCFANKNTPTLPIESKEKVSLSLPVSLPVVLTTQRGATDTKISEEGVPINDNLVCI